MIDRADRSGLGIALVGHALLFAALTLTIARRPRPVHAEPAVMDVQLVDTVGLQSAAPEPATEAPREATAPEAGPPEQAPPPEPATPTPTPEPPKPRPTPAPQPPAPKPAPQPAPAPTPTPTPAKPVARPTPRPLPAAARPTPARAAPRLSSDFLKDLPAARPGKGASAGQGERATAQRLGSDFLKGLPTPSAGKGATARAAVTGAAMNGLGAAIKRQVQPCYDLGALGGTPAMQIVTVLQLRFNKDGSIAGTPQLVEQQGVTPANRGYARQMEDVSRRAVLRCAPLRLPAELYAGGWENITMGFIPGQMQ